MDEYLQYKGVAETIGVNVEILNPEDVKDIWPLCSTDGLIGALVSVFSTNGIANDPNNFYTLAESYDWSYLYSIPSFLVFIALLIRRLRDIGKENLVFWAFCSLIPFYNLYIFAQPSSDKTNKG